MNAKNLRLKLIAALLTAIGALALGACGGDDGASDGGAVELSGDTDPVAVIESAFGGDSSIDSAVIDLAVSIDAAGPEGGSISVDLSGPFEARADDLIPLIDMDLNVSTQTPGADDYNLVGGATVTADAAFVNVDDVDYAVDPATFSSFQTFYAQSVEAQNSAQEGAPESSALFEQLGIDPKGWLTNATNEGVEEVGGADAVHISGQADVAKILADTQSLAQTTGQQQDIDPADLKRLTESLETATIDLFVGVDDGLLRQFAGDLSFEDDATKKADLTQADIVFSLGFSSVNEELDFTAPQNTRPLSELGGLGGIGLGAGAPSGGGGAPAPPQGGAGGGQGAGGPASGAGGDPLLECLQEAKTDDEVEACAAGGQQ